MGKPLRIALRHVSSIKNPQVQRPQELFTLSEVDHRVNEIHWIRRQACIDPAEKGNLQRCQRLEDWTRDEDNCIPFQIGLNDSTYFYP